MPTIYDEIRHRILEILYIHAQENPESFGLDRETMEKIMNVPEKTIFFNMQYLDQKGLLQLFRVIGNWISARITAFGIDVVENKEKYSEQFPFMVQEIHGDVYGTVVQAIESQVSFNQQVTDNFQKARDITETKDTPPTLKKRIMEHLDLLEEELKSKEPNAGKIQRLWKWLKKNASWVAPILAQAVLEGLRLALGKE